MAGMIRKSLDNPEEVRPFKEDSGQLELVNLAGGAVGRATFKPGWQGPSTSSRLRAPTAVRPPTWATSSPGA